MHPLNILSAYRSLYPSTQDLCSYCHLIKSCLYNKPQIDKLTLDTYYKRTFCVLFLTCQVGKLRYKGPYILPYRDEIRKDKSISYKVQSFI